jgi:hypothetical protein
MAKNRMAGEELERDNPVAEEARNSVADAADNKSLADRYGQDYVDSVKGDGLQDATGGGKYSRKELAAEFRYGRGDTSVDDTVAKYQGMVDSGEFKGNNKAQDFLKMHGVNFGGGGGGGGDNDDPVVEAPDTTPVAPPSNPAPSQPPVTPGPPMGSSTHTQIVNQDNDVNSNVTGDNNDVNINQDNSVSQFGGYTSDMNAGNKRAALGTTNLMDHYVLNLRKTKTTI